MKSIYVISTRASPITSREVEDFTYQDYLLNKHSPFIAKLANDVIFTVKTMK